jgi:hypothetical protein
VETVQQEIVEAMQTTRDEVIATAVTDGRLTEQMQRRMLMNRGQMGPMRGQMVGNCCGLESPLLDRTVMHTRLAELLGMSLDELEAAMAEGARPSQLMADADIDAETVRAAMTGMRETAPRPLQPMARTYAGIFAPMSWREFLELELPYRLTHLAAGKLYYKLIHPLHRRLVSGKPTLWLRRLFVADYPSKP